MTTIERSDQPLSEDKWQTIIDESQAAFAALASNPQNAEAWEVHVTSKSGESEKTERVAGIMGVSYSYLKESGEKTVELELTRLFNEQRIINKDITSFTIKVCGSELFSVRAESVSAYLDIEAQDEGPILEEITVQGASFFLQGDQDGLETEDAKPDSRGKFEA